MFCKLGISTQRPFSLVISSGHVLVAGLSGKTVFVHTGSTSRPVAMSVQCVPAAFDAAPSGQAMSLPCAPAIGASARVRTTPSASMNRVYAPSSIRCGGRCARYHSSRATIRASTPYRGFYSTEKLSDEPRVLFSRARKGVGRVGAYPVIHRASDNGHSRKLKERIYLSRAFKLLLRQAHATGEVERNCQHDHEARHNPQFDEHVLELFRAYPFDFGGEQ